MHRQTHTHTLERKRQRQKQRDTYTERMNFIHQDMPKKRPCVAWEDTSVVQNLLRLHKVNLQNWRKEMVYSS